MIYSSICDSWKFGTSKIYILSNGGETWLFTIIQRKNLP